jgi:hypothetical protein
VASDIGCRLFLGVATIWLASELARPRTVVQTVARLRLALISYWLLFVIVPLVLVLWNGDSEFGSGFGKSLIQTEPLAKKGLP